MINQPEIAAELAALHAEYEEALVSNDVPKLVAFFWDSEHALRFGAGESLYGARQIEEFRRNRPSQGLARTVFNPKIVTFGDDTGIVTIEFLRQVDGTPRHGRQSQVWRKLPEGWRIVSAHVSFVPSSFMDLAAAQIGMPIPENNRQQVQINIDRVGQIARPLLDYPIDDSIEAAPVFVP